MHPDLAGPHRRRGSDASLRDLYDAVPAAAQLDAHARLADETARTHLPPELAAADDRAVPRLRPGQDDSEDDLSEDQALGLLEHVLGAVLLADDEVS